jgi:hypothetical protein
MVVRSHRVRRHGIHAHGFHARGVRLCRLELREDTGGQALRADLDPERSVTGRHESRRNQHTRRQRDQHDAGHQRSSAPLAEVQTHLPGRSWATGFYQQLRTSVSAAMASSQPAAVSIFRDRRDYRRNFRRHPERCGFAVTFYAAGGIGSPKSMPHRAHWSASGVSLEPHRGQRRILAPTTINVTNATSESAHQAIATVSGHLWRKPNKLATKADIVRLNITRERRPRWSLIVMASDSMGQNFTQPGGFRRDGLLSHPRRHGDPRRKSRRRAARA